MIHRSSQPWCLGPLCNQQQQKDNKNGNKYYGSGLVLYTILCEVPGLFSRNLRKHLTIKTTLPLKYYLLLSELAQECNNVQAKASQFKSVLDCSKIANYFLVIQNKDIYATKESLKKDFCIAKKGNTNLKLELDGLIDNDVAVQIVNNCKMQRLAAQRQSLELYDQFLWEQEANETRDIGELVNRLTQEG